MKQKSTGKNDQIIDKVIITYPDSNFRMKTTGAEKVHDETVDRKVVNTKSTGKYCP